MSNDKLFETMRNIEIEILRAEEIIHLNNKFSGSVRDMLKVEINNDLYVEMMNGISQDFVPQAMFGVRCDTNTDLDSDYIVYIDTHSLSLKTK